jgi:chromatin-remodeling ATPase INO80
MNNQRLDVAKFGDTPSVAQSSRPSSHEVMKSENPFRSLALTPPKQKPIRANDPMSFASILSEPATRATALQDNVPLASKPAQLPAAESPSLNTLKVKMEIEQNLPLVASSTDVASKPMLNGHELPMTESASKPTVKPRKYLTAKEHESISRAMEALESQPLSDVEESDFVGEKERYAQKIRKRALELEDVENVKKKVRASEMTKDFS